jgi:glycolate oxidase FAD binding subunit
MTTTEPKSDPTSDDELVALVRGAAERGESLVVEGNGTKRHLGPAAPPEARRVSMRALARVTAHAPDDMLLSVEAGARLVDVQRALAVHDQWLPLDPPFAEATIGGILATNAWGPRRLGYGTSKDLLLGLRVVGARGQLTKSGGRVVKNVSGYDLHHLQVGAFGSLGVLVEAHFKVRARPAVSAVWALPRPTRDAAHRVLLALAATPLEPVALVALDAAEARRLPEGVGGQGAVALVGIEGSQATFERHVRELARFADGAAPRVVERPHVDAVWEALRELPARHAADVRVRLGARPHDLPALLAALELEGVPDVAIVVHVAVGLAHVSLPAPASEATLAALAARIGRWQQRATALGGYAVVESAPLALAGRATLPFGAPPTGLAADVRRAWDPRDTLNPGRMPW